MPVFPLHKPVYMCGRCRIRPGDYVARDNQPFYGHICSTCIITIPYNKRQHYSKVKTGSYKPFYLKRKTING